MDWVPAELNMGDPQSLIDFASYVKYNHSAERYMLVMWGPGEGMRGLSSTQNRATAMDYTSQDYLTISELEKGIAGAKSALGKNIDILVFDSSLMQLSEVMYGVAHHVDYMVGSQQVQPNTGIPYDKFLHLIPVYKDSPKEIARIIVDEYIKYYEENAGWNVTMSAVDLKKLNLVTRHIQKFSERFNQNFAANYPVFKEALETATYFDNNSIVDLYHFFSIIAWKAKDNTLRTHAENILIGVYDSVISHKVTEKNPVNDMNIDVSKTWGMSLYVPRFKSIYSKDNYSNTLFASKLDWGQVLDRYYNVLGTGENVKFVKRIEPTEVKILRARKNKTEYNYSQVSQFDFMHGYYGITGHFGSGPYKDDYYQLYMKFDFSDITSDEASKMKITQADIYLWAGEDRMYERSIVGKLNTALASNFIQNDQVEHYSDIRISQRRIYGTSLGALADGWIKKSIENHGIVAGYDILNKNYIGYLRNVIPERIYMIIEYEY
jgi:hypothetical protein